MKVFTSAWFVAIGLTVYRGAKYRVDGSGAKVKAPPQPGEIIKLAGLFVLLALLAETGEGQQKVASLIAWGVDGAAVINLVSGHPNPVVGGTWPPPTIPDTTLLPGGKADAVQGTPGATASSTSSPIANQPPASNPLQA